MLSAKQVGVLIGYAGLLWAAAAAWIRFAPTAIATAVPGDLAFLFSAPLCWICLLLMRRIGRVADGQMLAAASLVVGVATLIDASALRWAPYVYGSDERVLRLGAAWLLWGYGLTLLMVLLPGWRRARRTGTATGATPGSL